VVGHAEDLTRGPAAAAVVAERTGSSAHQCVSRQAAKAAIDQREEAPWRAPGA
jgi:hypothetical protein